MKSLRVSIQEATERGWLAKNAGKIDLALTKRPTQSTKAASQLAAAMVKTKPKRRQDREGNEQCVVIETFDLEFPALAGRLFHIANGGKRTKLERYLMVKQGVRKGVLDLMLPVPVHPYHGLFVEMKAPIPHASAVSSHQADWLKFLTEQGYFAKVARGSGEAMDIIRSYLSTAP